jgi:hypothetical protein
MCCSIWPKSANLQKDVGEAEIFLESAVEMCLSVFDKPSAEDAHADDA